MGAGGTKWGEVGERGVEVVVSVPTVKNLNKKPKFL